MRSSNAYGNTSKQLRKFLRENGIRPTASNVELIGREVRRTASQNERVEQIARETGRAGTFDAKGPVVPRVKRAVKSKIEQRRPK